jgi:hypothetical protein
MNMQSFNLSGMNDLGWAVKELSPFWGEFVRAKKLDQFLLFYLSLRAEKFAPSGKRHSSDCHSTSSLNIC